MDAVELASKLSSLGVRPRSYSLDGREQDGRYCMERFNGGWAVFYGERGERREESWHGDEEGACGRLLQVISEDPTTRAR